MSSPESALPPRLLETPDSRAAAQTHAICRQMFFEIAVSEYDFFHVALKLLKWESCLPKKPSFKNESRGRGEASIPFAGISKRAFPLRDRARAGAASTDRTGPRAPCALCKNVAFSL